MGGFKTWNMFGSFSANWCKHDSEHWWHLTLPLQSKKKKYIHVNFLLQTAYETLSSNQIFFKNLHSYLILSVHPFLQDSFFPQLELRYIPEPPPFPLEITWDNLSIGVSKFLNTIVNSNTIPQQKPYRNRRSIKAQLHKNKVTQHLLTYVKSEENTVWQKKKYNPTQTTRHNIYIDTNYIYMDTNYWNNIRSNLLFGCKETTMANYLPKQSKQRNPTASSAENSYFPINRILYFSESQEAKKYHTWKQTEKKQPKRRVEKYYFKVSGAADIHKISVDSFIF